MWVLVWLALEANQEVDYYHIGTYDTDKECQVSLKEAVVLVTIVMIVVGTVVG